MRGLLAACAVLLAAPSLAGAQTWEEHRYSEAGFAVQFPAEPKATSVTYRTATGMTAPATAYTATLENVIYAVTVADVSKLSMDDDVAVEDAIKALGAMGEITVDVTERINRRYGHELGVNGKDGSRAAASVFAFDHRLYLLFAQAMPPNAAAGSGKISRFQQSLQFLR